MEEFNISVIIPSYNREYIIADVIDRVIAQTLPVKEIVVVDDASTDRTVDIVKGKADKVRIVIVELKKNVGGAKARNIGADHSSGDYLAFLDSDDLWKPDHLERRVLNLKSALEGGATMGGMVNDRSASGAALPRDAEFVESAARMAEIILRGGSGIRTSTFFLPKHKFQGVRFDDNLPKHQDWDFAIRYAAKFPVRLVNESTCVMTVSTGNRMSFSSNSAASVIFIERHKHLLDRRLITRFCLMTLFNSVMAGSAREEDSRLREEVPFIFLGSGWRDAVKSVLIHVPFLWPRVYCAWYQRKNKVG